MNRKLSLLLLLLFAGLIVSCEVNLQKNKAIDTATINKIVYLNVNLEHGFETMRDKSEELLVAIKKTVERKKNPTEGVEIIKKAENLKRTSANMLGMIERIKKYLYNNIGGGPLNRMQRGHIRNPAETRGIAEMMMGNKKDGKGYLIQKELDEYVAYLNENFGGADQETYNSPRLKNFEMLTKDYQNDYVAQKKSTATDTDFARYHFANAPVIEVLVTLTSKQIEVVRYEIKCLEKMNTLARQLAKE